MKKSFQYKLFVFSNLLILLFLSFVSCSKDDVKLNLIDTDFQKVVIKYRIFG